MQGLSGTALGFLQLVPLISYYAKLFILGSTPRSVYDIKYTMRGVAWGTLFPATTLISVISESFKFIDDYDTHSYTQQSLTRSFRPSLMVWRVPRLSSSSIYGSSSSCTSLMFLPRVIRAGSSSPRPFNTSSLGCTSSKSALQPYSFWRKIPITRRVLSRRVL